MNSYRRSLPLLMLATTFALAFLAMAFPLVEWLRVLRPNIVALFLIYWLMRIPENIGVGFAWFVGLLFDGVSGGLLGQHALSFSFIAYLVLLLHQRVRMFGVAQQAVLVSLFLLFDQFIGNWVVAVFRGDGFTFMPILSAITGAMCWPPMSAWLNHYQRRHFSMS